MKVDENSSLKILLFDIETAPCECWSWGLWNELKSTKMIKQDWYVICWCAKWLGSKEVISSHAIGKDDKECMVQLRDLLSEADIVIGQNGDNFDIKKVNTRFIIHGLTPPSPFKSIDTLKIARRCFKFTSNRLDDLGQYLGVGRKIDTGGFELWKGCMSGDKKSLDKMIKYCKRDVTLLEKVFIRLRQYAKDLPSMRYLRVNGVCHRCGSDQIQFRGYGVNGSGKYRRTQCKKCGGWSRGIHYTSLYS